MFVELVISCDCKQFTIESTSMAMEMRARESTNMSEDLTPPIAPYAAALYDSYLHSHCSSCFRPLQSSSSCFSCTTCCAIRYCCSDCLSSDSTTHSSSSECCFFVNLKSTPTCHISYDTADFRAALRLLYLFEMCCLAPSHWTEPPNRIGGLLASGIEEVLQEGGEVAERIQEGSLLMSSARRMKKAQTVISLHRGVTAEKVALWVVMTNGVEVQVSEGKALGVAVYGPSFSWFNHSCLPNACYWFELAPWYKDSTSCQSDSRIFPASTGEALDAWHAWKYEEDGSSHELCKYAPRIVVRSTKPIKKGEEVCITYIDLLQTRPARHSDLWSKYRFICCCPRCTASPELYVDHVLNYDARNLNVQEKDHAAPETEGLDYVLDQAVAEYSLGDNPKACCHMIENMLSENSRSDLQHDELSGRKCTLHPLHHISLSAYMTLASAYRFCALSLNSNTGSLHEENSSDFFKMAKAAAAYSFLLAGATHHLFLTEQSFMTATSHFLLSAGESILYLVGSIREDHSKKISKAKFSLISCSQATAKGNSMQYHEFTSTCEEYTKCMLSLSLRCWPCLVQSLPYLEKIKNPVNFSWLGTVILQPQLSFHEEDTAIRTCTYESGVFIEEQKECLLNLAVCCISYCKYLASICYGPRHYLVGRAKDLLEGIGLAK